MQFKALAAFALGATLAAATSIPASQCSTGQLQCCNSTGTAKDASISKLLGLLGVVVQDVTALVGVTCTPITVIGAGGNSWWVISLYITSLENFTDFYFILFPVALLNPCAAPTTRSVSTHLALS